MREFYTDTDTDNDISFSTKLEISRLNCDFWLEICSSRFRNVAFIYQMEVDKTKWFYSMNGEQDYKNSTKIIYLKLQLFPLRLD